MEKAEEIFQTMIDEMPFNLNRCFAPYIIEAIKIGQKEAYNEAIKHASMQMFSLSSSEIDKVHTFELKSKIMQLTRL